MKKLLTVWQMIALAGILLAVAASALIPIITINEGKIKSAIESEVMAEIEKNGMGGEISSQLIESTMETIMKPLEEEIKELEEEYGVSLSSITGYGLLFGSYGDAFEKISKDSHLKMSKFCDGMNSSLTMLRAGMGIFYFGAVLLMGFIILSFCLKINRYLPTIITAVYSVAGSAFFGYCYWGISARWAGSGVFGDVEFISSTLGGMLRKIFVGPGFLVTFCIMLCLTALSVCSIFVGKKQEVEEYGAGFTAMEQQTPGYNSFADPAQNPDPMAGTNQNSIPATVFAQGAASAAAPVAPAAPAAAAAPVPPAAPVAPAAAADPAAPATFPAPSVSAPPRPMGRVQCIAGVLAGQGYRLPEENKIVVGKDPGRCTMVVNDPYVSGVHCSIRYNAAANTYIVRDYSSNGTYVNDRRMQKETAAEYPAGTILLLANGANQIKLG